MFTNYFCKVTSNLNNCYNEATFALWDVYKTGNQEKLNEALMDLITGEARNREGTLDRLFNKEHKDLDKLKLVELALKQSCTDEVL
jgi:hypothetical protein